MKDLIGQKFGRLTPIKYVGEHKWLCKCDCDNEVIAVSYNLKNGNTKSCGCLRRKGNRLAHGHNRAGRGSKTYASWNHMKQRCGNSNDKRYKDYGGRKNPITVCDRWDVSKGGSFENFLEDMGECPGRGYSIDRIDNDGNYCKENCRWATRKEQNRNTRKNIYLTHNNKTQLLLDWSKEYGINYTTLYNRIYISNWSIDKALTTPIKKYKNKIGK